LRILHVIATHPTMSSRAAKRRGDLYLGVLPSLGVKTASTGSPPVSPSKSEGRQWHANKMSSRPSPPCHREGVFCPKRSLPQCSLFLQVETAAAPKSGASQWHARAFFARGDLYLGAARARLRRAPTTCPTTCPTTRPYKRGPIMRPTQTVRSIHPNGTLPTRPSREHDPQTTQIHPRVPCMSSRTKWNR